MAKGEIKGKEYINFTPTPLTPQHPRSHAKYADSLTFGVNIILLQHIQFHIVHLYRQFTLDLK